MSKVEDKRNITEPETVHCLFCTGIHLEALEGCIRLVGYADLDMVEYEQSERRIITRVVMPHGTARQLLLDLRKMLAKGGH
jgi:hypothetical protein